MRRRAGGRGRKGSKKDGERGKLASAQAQAVSCRQANTTCFPQAQRLENIDATEQPLSWIRARGSGSSAGRDCGNAPSEEGGKEGKEGIPASHSQNHSACVKEIYCLSSVRRNATLDAVHHTIPTSPHNSNFWELDVCFWGEDRKK